MTTTDNDIKKSLVALEEEVLLFWKRFSIFEKSIFNRRDKLLYSFYDGPPFATGLPHYGHFLSGTIKDVVARYKTMEGYFVPRRFGWDCHGVPIEFEIEKHFHFSSREDIEAFGIANFNEECRKIVQRFSKAWESRVARMGRWVDFSTTWKTMDLSFMESVWWVFSQLYSQGLVYEGLKVVAFSTKLGTPLSNFEASQNYKEVDDPSIVVKFPLKNEDNTYFLVWTTTPWTLFANMAIAVSPDLDYVKVKDIKNQEVFIIGKTAFQKWFNDYDNIKIIEEFKGTVLEGTPYIPIFSNYSHKAEAGAFRVILGEHVLDSEGTSLVHTAPGFGEDDFQVCQRYGVPLVSHISNTGLFTQDVPEFKNRYFLDTNKDIIKKLKSLGLIFYQGTIRHRYPFCWRTDTPLMYKVVTTWFISVEKIKDRLVRVNQEINWIPNHIKNGRFGKWLEGARDWAISRNRFWGTPIPIWKSKEGDILVISSVKELEEATGIKVTDLHRHHIDHLKIIKEGKEYTRVPEIFDCWFDAGSMPYGQNHYPFENKEITEKSFPADFIAEGLDQTRGWFYTLNIISSALFNQPAFKNVIVNGIVLAEDGQKMSKRLSNYPDPDVVINKYGADAIRLYMLHSPVVKGEEMKFSEKGVENILKQILLPFWNAYTFFSIYAEIYNWSSENQKEISLKNDLDKWIFSNINILVEKVREGLDSYQLNLAVEPFVSFIDSLTNWYIRRSRRRFWSEEDSEDRQSAFYTLHRVLLTLCKIAAPFIPFLSETIYQRLKNDKMPESVHICDFPKYDHCWDDIKLVEEMNFIRRIVSLSHTLRKQEGLKVRQPLSCLHIIPNSVLLNENLSFNINLILEEINVKEVKLYDFLPDFIELNIKPNFRVLGKKMGSSMKEIQKIIMNFSNQEKLKLFHNQSLKIVIDNKEFELVSDDVVILLEAKKGFVSLSDDLFTIILDCRLDDNLIAEGICRELVNKINTMRKSLQLHVTSRIGLEIQAPSFIKEIFIQFQDHIFEETLSTSVAFLNKVMDGESWDINGYIVNIKIIT